MSALTGGLIAGIVYGKNPATFPLSKPGSNLAITGLVEPGLSNGTNRSAQPTRLLKTALTGSLIQNLGTDIFNRIWVIPTSVDFGDISVSNTAISRSIRLWNAYPHTARTLESLNVINDQDVSVTAISLPKRIPAFGEVNFDIIAGPFGKQALDAYIPVVFDQLGDVWDIQISGNRLESQNEVLQLSPVTVDFGMLQITETASTVVTVWNSDSARSMTIASISGSNNQGIIVTGMAFPCTIPPLGSTTFTVTAQPSTDPYIATNLSIYVSNIAVTYNLAVYGSRFEGAVIPVVPNWSAPVVVNYDFKTDIITSRDGTEQRRALRQTPRKTVSFTALLYGTTGMDMRTILRKWAAGVMFLADPSRSVQVEEGVPADTNSLIVASVPRWLTADSYVVLTHSDTSTFRKVSEINGNVITFSDVSEIAWGADTKICACLYGRLSDSPQIQAVTDSVATFSLVFQCLPGSETDTSNGTVGATYDNREVLEWTPQWSTPLSDTFQWIRDEVNFDFGLVEYYLPTTFGIENRQANILCDGNAQDIIDFFCRMRGQAGEFFATTFQSDFSMVTISGVNLTVEGATLYDYYNSDSPVGFLCFTLDDGTTQYKKIESVSVDSNGNTLAVLDAAVDNQDSISRISLLVLSRFMNDTLSVSYMTDTIAGVNITVGSRPYSPSE